MAPEVTVASSHPEIVPGVNEGHEYFSNDFGQPTLQPCNHTGLTLDGSPMFDYEQGDVGWEDFDSGNIDWCLLGTFPLERAETYAKLPPPLRISADSRAGLAVVALSADSLPTIVERSWYTRLDSRDAPRANSPEINASGATTPDNSCAPRTEINELYRQSLYNRLRPKWSEEPLPSTEFLVSNLLRQIANSCFSN